MNITFTGRVLNPILGAMQALRPILRAQPNGLWAYPETGISHPLYHRLPHPLHPLEVIAAGRRIMGCMENDFGHVQFFSDPGIVRAMTARHEGWLPLTAFIARGLGVPSGTIRLLWHALTPMNVEDEYDGMYRALCNYLYEAAGHDCPFEREPTGPPRPNFWNQELEGEIEL